ncbi:hypothetical protein [Erythrobacter rubeus]|uniref:DUF3850 domain-containing protein n=1 Tax=Erythrobacter rubeus TaxID=2760803 RepID=A0ABR8KTD6_9SPHN|nr:hypothetical protein [Erythrobacter rubeus]MBD2842692.1 hypothetical protein [Erythrobacter rubeus]
MFRGILHWLLGNQAVPSRQPDVPKVIDRRGLNEDWQAGDLALCLCHDLTPVPDGRVPRRGQIYRVRSIIEGSPQGDDGVLYTALVLDGFPLISGWWCSHFCKVRPEENAADLSECEQLRDLVKRHEMETA